MLCDSDAWVVRLGTMTHLQIRWYASLPVCPGYRTNCSQTDVGETLLLDCVSIRLAMMYTGTALSLRLSATQTLCRSRWPCLMFCRLHRKVVGHGPSPRVRWSDRVTSVRGARVLLRLLSLGLAPSAVEAWPSLVRHICYIRRSTNIYSRAKQ